nr:FtsQ-type POTRA domain-containing protein [Desulfobacula sp.]
MNKKITPNRYKPEPDEASRFQAELGTGINVCLKFIMVVAFFSILGLAAIFVHDFITQAEFFNITQIEVIGANHASREDILGLADLNRSRNIYELNTSLTEKKIATHPWVQSVSLRRESDSKLKITLKEQEPLALVRIKNTAEVLINIQGKPFKEYEPETDRLESLPVITGLELTKSGDQYGFASILFDSVMDFLKTGESGPVERIDGHKNTGVTLQTKNFTKPLSAPDQDTVPIKLGFDNFKAKLKKAKKISEYIDKNLPERTICAMDLFNIEKVFIKTKLNNDALHNNLKKGA